MGPRKINVKDRVSENGDVDLSMSDLDTVPVKEIAALKRIYSLDLSNNNLSTLPDTFPSLTRLIKIDLSRNVLTELPENFGDLAKLKHLDLFQNKLQHLPLSFHKLKELKWLDLKDNNLVPAVAKVAGPCDDTKQCQACAKNIVKFFTQLQFQVDTEKQAREQQRLKQLELNQQKEKQSKKNKKKEKTEKVANLQEPSIAQSKVPSSKKTKTHQSNNIVKNIEKRKKSSLSFLILFLISIFVLFILTSIGYLSFIENYFDIAFTNTVNSLPNEWKPYAVETKNFVKDIHIKTSNVTLEIINYLYKSEQLQTTMFSLNSIYRNVIESIKGLYK